MDVLSPFISILLSFWLTLPQRVLSTTWCCLSRLCVVFLACVHWALFLALFLSPGNSLVSSWCDHSMLASLLWQCPTVPSLFQLCWEPTHLFSLLSTKHAESFSILSSQRPNGLRTGKTTARDTQTKRRCLIYANSLTLVANRPPNNNAPSQKSRTDKQRKERG